MVGGILLFARVLLVHRIRKLCRCAALTRAGDLACVLLCLCFWRRWL